MTKHLANHPVNNSTYTNHGCRCDGCRTAAREYARQYRWHNPRKEQERLARVRAKRARGEWLGRRGATAT